MGESPFAIAVQAIGTLMVAALLWQMTRLIPGRHLRYWSFAWVCLSWATFSLRMTKANQFPTELRPLGFAVFLGAEYLFGFFLWAGLRDYAKPTPWTWRDALPMALLLPLAAAMPWVIHEPRLLPIHTAIMAAFFSFSFAASMAIAPRIPRQPVGLNIVRVLLAGLAVMFLLFTPLLAWDRFNESVEGQFVRLSLIDYALIEMGLAFGLLVLAAERAQEMLEEKNLLLAEASRRDALTGLYNRRHFDEVLEDKKHQPGGGALAIIDLNDLKKINDRYLHPAGDGALKLVARALVSKFRVTDPIFRLGGDEFAVLMPTASEADMAGRMADIDDALMNLRVPGVPEPMDLRIAWGLAGYSSGADLPDAVTAADRAMYACKARRKANPIDL